MNMKSRPIVLAARQLTPVLLLAECVLRAAEVIPLPEHPRPDFQRADWQNLNGTWEFRFDADDSGLKAGWSGGKTEFPLRITVPFPCGSRLSGVKDESPIGS